MFQNKHLILAEKTKQNKKEIFCREANSSSAEQKFIGHKSKIHAQDARDFDLSQIFDWTSDVTFPKDAYRFLWQ